MIIKKKYRIMVVAPYEAMQGMVQKICETEFPNVELTIVVGCYEKGLRQMRNYSTDQFDVIVSRGGTAQLLQKYYDSIPIVAIQVSALDILRAQRLAHNATGRYALVSNNDFVKSIRLLNEILHWNMDVYSYQLNDTCTPPELFDLITELRDKGYQGILCDTAPCFVAKQIGMNVSLLTSGVESIREAFVNAIQICDNLWAQQSEKRFFQQLLSACPGELMVFCADGSLKFSHYSGQQEKDVSDMLCREIPNVEPNQPYRFTKNRSGLNYRVKARSFEHNGTTYISFFFTTRKSEPALNRSGIHYLSTQDLIVQKASSLCDVLSDDLKSQGIIKSINFSDTPLLIAGECGTEPENVVAMLHLSSNLHTEPLVQIDCGILSHQSWLWLTESHNSPINSTNCTLFFKNVDLLSTEKRRQLTSLIVESKVQRRDKLFFSCTCPEGATNSAIGSELQEQLSTRLYTIPPVRMLTEYLSQMINMLIINFNSNLPIEIYGLEQGAMDVLAGYHWPRNFMQLRRIVFELAQNAGDQLIRAKDAQQLLQEERENLQSASSANSALNLDETLDNITKQVVKVVLEKCGGNQTAAAKRLEIGRSTLWRLLKE